MSYDECMLKGDRGRCASWPILDAATQVHPGINLGGGGNGVCISHAQQLLRDVRTGHADAYDEAGSPTDLEGRDRVTGATDPDYRRAIERVHEVYELASGHRYLGMRNRRVTVAAASPLGARKEKPSRTN